MPKGIGLYVATDHRSRYEPRLIVACDVRTVTAMIPHGMIAHVASPWEAYRLGKKGVELEYAKDTYRGVTAL